jgi:hypothetical protein
VQLSAAAIVFAGTKSGAAVTAVGVAVCITPNCYAVYSSLQAFLTVIFRKNASLGDQRRSWDLMPARIFPLE